MKISIITITYNSVKTLQRALDSVQNQTYSDIEHILVDGASTDGTREMIEAYAAAHPNIKWVSEKDSGIYNAINKGLRMATGDIVGFLHSDDVYYNTDSIAQIAMAFTISHADVVYSDLQYCRADKVVRRWKSNPFHPSTLKYGWMPPHPTMFCRRSVYEQVGTYDERFRISADYDMVLRIFHAPRSYRVYYVPEVLVSMELGGASNRNLQARWAKTREDYRVVKKNHIGAGYLTIACKQLRKIKQFIR